LLFKKLKDIDMKKKIILTSVITLIIIIGICAYLFVKATRYSLVDFEQNDKKVLMDTVNQFIFDIVTKNLDEAYQLTDKKSISLEELKNIASHDVLKTYKAQNTNFHALIRAKFISGRKIISYQTRILFSDNIQGQIQVDAIKEPDTSWMIYGFNLTTPPDRIW
jgi:hypothetical protein